MIARPLPPPRYSSWQAINVAITLGLRALEEVRALATKAAPVERGPVVDAAEIERMVAEAVAKLPGPKRGPEGAPGKFTPPTVWVKGIRYEGALVTHGGSTYCAGQDTADEPPHKDWVLVAARGADAPVGEVYGLHDEHKEYRRLDTVHRDGAEWRAIRDNPGSLPGDGWVMSARQGKPGVKGEPGLRGDPGAPGKPGPPGPTISRWVKDGYRAIPMMSDGTAGPALDVREFFELYHGEAR